MALKGFKQSIILLADGLDSGAEFSAHKSYIKRCSRNYSIW